MTASYNDTLARPPRVTTGAAGWARENLFGTWCDALLTVICGTALALWGCGSASVGFSETPNGP